MSSLRSGKLDLGGDNKYNAGLPDKVGNIPDIDGFGDSGDIFNHGPWRDLFLFLATDTSCNKQIIGLATQPLLRARQTKIENKGSAVTYTMDISKLDKSILKSEFGITASSLFAFRLVYATETTRVPGDVLTPERLKCAIRTIIVPKMMLVGRFPATSSAIGFDTMAKELKAYKDLVAERAAERSREHMGEEIIEGEEQSMPVATSRAWDSLMNVATKHGVGSWINTSAMYSASITQKEIYDICEETYPGTVLWAGIHCIMTDISNKKKATEVTADIRARYENSNFYGDFKRKQTARGIPVVKTEAYLDYLEAAGVLMAKYLRASTGLSQKEVSIMDYVMRSVNEKFEAVSLKATMTTDTGMSSSEPSDVADHVAAMQRKLIKLKKAPADTI